MSDDKGPSKKAASLKPDVQAKLGQKLKEVYSDVINEPVPDRFLDLLNQLEESSSEKDKNSEMGSK